MLSLELEADLTDGQVPEYYASLAEYEDNAAATLSLLSHYMEELKTKKCRIPGSAATNIENESTNITGSRVLGDQMKHGLIGSCLPNLELLHVSGRAMQ